MPSPGRRSNSSVLAKRNPTLLAHAAITEYDVVLAEHAFHELRLASIAVGRSVSQATSSAPPRTASRTTSQSLRHAQLGKNQQILQPHLEALEAIRSRRPQLQLPLLPGPSNSHHRNEVAKATQLDNHALAHRLDIVHSTAPTAADCLEAEKARAAIVSRLRTVKGPGLTQPELTNERARELEMKWEVKPVQAPVPPLPPLLPAIVDAHGHSYATPRALTTRSTAPKAVDTSAEPAPAAVTARVRLPARPPKLPVKQRPGPPQTLVPLAVALLINPRNSGSSIVELHARARASMEGDEDRGRVAVDATEKDAREALAVASANDVEVAEARRAARERREAADKEERQKFEGRETTAREKVFDEDTASRQALSAAASKSQRDATEATRARIEREKVKAKRKLDAVDGEEGRARDDVMADEESEYGHIRKQWRKVIADSEDHAALAARKSALSTLESSVRCPLEGTDWELIAHPPEESSRSNWRSLGRVCIKPDDQAVRLVARSDVDDASTLRVRLLLLNDGYIAIAPVGFPGRLCAAEASSAASFTAASDEAIKTLHGSFAFEVDLASSGQTQPQQLVFGLKAKHVPGQSLKVTKSGTLVLATTQATGTEAPHFKFSLLSASDSDADEASYAQAQLEAAAEAAQQERQRIAAARRAAVEAAVGGSLDATYEMCLADDPVVRINRSAVDDRSKMRAGDRWNSALDQLRLVIDDEGFVTFVAPDNTAWGITSPGKTQAAVGLRFETLAGKEETALFELEPLPSVGDHDTVRRFFMHPKAHPDMVVEVKMDSEQKKLILVNEAEASALAEFTLQTTEDAHAFYSELESQEGKQTADKAASARALRQANVAELLQGHAHETLFEVALAEDAAYRFYRAADDGHLAVGARTNTPRDQFTIVGDDDGYLLITSALDGAVVTATRDVNGKWAVSVTGPPAEGDVCKFEVDASPPSPSQSQAHDRVFSLRPKVDSSFVVEVDIESQALAVIPDSEASNLSEFVLITFEAAEAAHRAQLAEEGLRDRCDALEVLIGDPELMTIYDVLPACAPMLRVAVPESQPNGLTLEDFADSEGQQFVFADVGDGYVNLVPWSSPQAAVTANINSADEPCFVAEGSTNVEGQFYFVQLGKETGTFRIISKDAPTKCLHAEVDARRVLLKDIDDSPGSFFMLLQRSAEQRERLGGAISPTSADDRDAERRSETLRVAVGDFIDEVTVVEIHPADASRLRLCVQSTGENGPVAGDGVAFKPSRGTSAEQFTMVEAGDGFVHLVSWAEPSLALCVGDDGTSLTVQPIQVGKPGCSFEIAFVDKSPTKSPKSQQQAARKFFLIARQAPHNILDVTDDESSPVAMLPDTALSPFAELCVVSKDASDIERAQRTQVRRQSKLDALAKSRRDACVSVFGDVRRELVIVAIDDVSRRLSAVVTPSATSARVIHIDDAKDAIRLHSTPVIVPVPQGYAAVKFMGLQSPDKVHFLAMNGTESDGAHAVIMEMDAEISEEAVNIPDTAHFEIVITESSSDSGSRSFCFAPRIFPQQLLEAQLDSDGHLTLVSASALSSFAEFRVGA